LLAGEHLPAPPSIDDFRAFVQSRATDIYGGIISLVVGSTFPGWNDERTLLGNMDKGLSVAAKYAATNLTSLKGPKGYPYTLRISHAKTHSRVIAHAKGGSLSCEIADVILVCKYLFFQTVLYERAVLVQVKAEGKFSLSRWKVDWQQLLLYHAWPMITKFTRGAGVPISGFPQNLTVKPASRLFSTFMLAKRHVFPFPFFLDSDHDMISADLLYSATINVGRRTFKGAGEISFSDAIWNLVLQSIGEELIANGMTANNDAKVLVDALLRYIGVPDSVERERLLIRVEIDVSSASSVG